MVILFGPSLEIASGGGIKQPEDQMLRKGEISVIGNRLAVSRTCQGAKGYV